MNELTENLRQEVEQQLKQAVGIEEIRTVDPDTGGEKGQKITRFDLIPIGPLRELAAHYGKGSKKYEDRNWELGYLWSLSYQSLMNHLTQFWNGEDYDEETGSKHIIAVAWHAFALAEFMETHPEKDNRPNPNQEVLF